MYASGNCGAFDVSPGHMFRCARQGATPCRLGQRASVSCGTWSRQVRYNVGRSAVLASAAREGEAVLTEQNDEQAPVVWDQPDPPARPYVPLDRARIVAAAIKLADEQGLEAFTMRKLAAVLGASPMSLYRHVARKEDLIDLMLDHIVGTYDLSGIPSGDWRADLVTLARQQRAAALHHPWSIIPVVRPALGPNAIAHLETALSVFDATPLPVAWKAWATNLVETYVRGSVEAELADAAAERSSGMTTEQWQRTMQPYLERLLATGRYPRVKAFFDDENEITRDEAFERGLTTILDGIAGLISGSTAPPG